MWVREQVGNVYLVENTVTGVFKIGASKYPKKRASACSREVKARCVLRASVETVKPFVVERKLHRHYAASRTTGEWFNLSADEAIAFTAVAEQYRIAPGPPRKVETLGDRWKRLEWKRPKIGTPVTNKIPRGDSPWTK